MKVSKVFRTTEGKECTSCGNFYAFDSYPPHSTSPDGYYPRCRDCKRKYDLANFHRKKHTYEAKRNTLKEKYAQALGGKCSRCGYSEFMAGLDFHHLEDKEHSVSTLITNARSGNAKWLNLLEAELSKCILLCRNCHTALHAGDWVLSEVQEKQPRYVTMQKQARYDLIGLPLFGEN